MAIREISPGGGVVFTGPHIHLFALMSMRGRLKLELLGLRSQTPTAPAVRKAIGSTTRSKQRLLDELNAYIEKYVANHPPTEE